MESLGIDEYIEEVKKYIFFLLSLGMFLFPYIGNTQPSYHTIFTLYYDSLNSAHCDVNFQYYRFR